ncbi:MAG: PaaI family thioesterase [Desulfonatronovibrionaceae bacterium]
MPAYCIQKKYPEQYCHCYGCGMSNPDGLGIRSYWDGQKAVARFTPDARHIAVPGYVYGGLIASLVDCHGIATAAAAAGQARSGGDDPDLLDRYVTASLQVNFLKPTPLGTELEIWGEVISMDKGKLLVDVTVKALGQTTVSGQVLAAPMPENMA